MAQPDTTKLQRRTGFVGAHIEDEQRDQLAALARLNDRSVAAEIRTAIRERVEREKGNRT